jgi:AhpD family alkylhydroperoxidase
LAPLEQGDPEFARIIERVAVASMEPGALDRKTKLLIALALDAAHGAAQGVSSIAQALRASGTSDAEIAEALRVAYFASGNSILATSFAAFKKP